MRFSKLDSVQADLLDFIPRERRGEIRRLVFAFMAVALILFGMAYLPSLASVAAYAPLVGIVLLAILCLYVAYRTQIDIDLVMASEFQNMLFSQALGIGSLFAMIVRRDGTIVHTSDGLSDVFPTFDYASSQALEGLFEQGTVRKLDRDRILDAIRSGGNERLVFPVVSQYREKKDYILTVEPLPRPAGFSLVRGREYLGQRAGLQMLPDSLRSTTGDKLDHLLSTTSTAHYTTDQYGRFEYVNPAFEYLFGYQPHQIVEAKLSLHHLFFSFDGQALTEEYSISDFNGPAVILTQANGRENAEIRQHAIRDVNGKAVGLTGSIFPA